MNKFTEELLKPLRAAAFFASHTVLAMLLLVGIYGVERLISYLWGVDTRAVFFGRIPIRYFFDALDCSVLVMFVVFGTKAAWRAFRD